MPRTLSFRLEELLGTERSCDVVTPQDLDAISAGRLSAARRAELDRHAAGCPYCEEFLANLPEFLRACAPGGGRVRSSFHEADEKTRAALGFAPRRNRPRVRLPFLAAAAALLAGFAALVVLVPSRSFPVSVAEAPLEDPPSVRGTSPVVAIERARAALQVGDYHRALHVLDDALEKHPNHTFLLHDQGVVRLRAGDAAGAVESFRASSAAQGVASGETLFWLSVALSRSGDPGAACTAMRRVAQLQNARSEEARQIVAQYCSPE